MSPSIRFNRDAAPLVVGVGASAGGIEAFTELLQAMRDTPDVAIVFVQHVHDQELAELIERLSQSTPFRVMAVSERTKMRPQSVYVCPPRTLLECQHGALKARPADEQVPTSTPIDHFLHSLAADQGERCIGIILSGAGSDGTLGLKAISDAGGMTFAQSADSATYASMPRSAATTGVADHVLSPPEIADELRKYARYLTDAIPQQRQQDYDSQIHAAIPTIAKLLKAATRHNFQHYKPNTLARRIRRRLQVLKLADVESYIDFLTHDADEPFALFRELLISVTAFFRDREAFEELSKSVLPKLFADRAAGDVVRIWVPGCATGEEAFTLAILCREQMEPMQSPPGVQIFATDIDEHALKVGRQGTYPLGIEEDISEERLKRYFVKRGKKYQVVKEIRELVLFSSHNLISDPPFSRQDLISCRNLLIYLDPPLQRKLMPLFHYALRPAGYLMLGPSENVSSHGDLFRSIDSQYRISQRKDTSVDAAATVSLTDIHPAVRDVKLPLSSTQKESDDLTQIMQRIVLDEFAPKSIIVEEDGRIVCASADMHKYLTVGNGNFENNVIKMARNGLRVGLRASLHEAKATLRRVVLDNLSVMRGGKWQRVMLTVQPMPRVGQQSELFLVVFQDSGLPLAVGQELELAAEVGVDQLEDEPNSRQARSMIEQLERELSVTQSDLEQSVQELETTNEELKSSNEELLSLNEEMRAANEELATSKEEIQAGIVALAMANSDLENLFQSTQIATLFLDSRGNLVRFTPAASHVYNLIPTDVGRPLSHITHKALAMPPIPSLEELEQANEFVEHEIQSRDGRWFLRRALPYFHQERVEGVILTFIDVTDRKRALIRLATMHRIGRVLASDAPVERILSQILQSLRELMHSPYCAIWMVDADSQRMYCAESSFDPNYRSMQRFADESRPLRFALNEGLPGFVWHSQETHWIEDLSVNVHFSRRELATEIGLVSGIALPIVVGAVVYGVIEFFTSVRLKRDQALLETLQSVGHEIGQFIARKSLSEQLRDEEARKTAILEAAIDAIVTMDVEGRIVDFNPAAERIFGFSKAEIQGRLLADTLIPPDYRAAHTVGLQRYLTTGKATVLGRRLELTALHKDGTLFPIELAINATTARDGTPFFTAHLRDITEQRQFVQAIVDRENQITTLLNSTAEGIYGIDLNGICTFANASCVRMLGYESPSQIVGQHMHELVHHSLPDGTPYATADCRIYRAFRLGEHVHADDECYWRADGSSFEVEYWSYPQQQDGKLIGCVVTFLDISERKKAELELQQRMSQLDLALDSGGMGIWEWEIDGDSVTWSTQLYEMFGYQRQAFESTKASFLKAVHPDDRSQIESMIKSAFASNCINHEIEFRVIRGDNGEVVWTHCHGSVHRSPEGKPQSILSVAVDITERKQRELALRFLANLQSRLAGFTSVEDIIAEAGQQVSEYLQLSHLMLVNMDEAATLATILSDHCSHSSDCLVGSYDMSDLASEDERRELVAGMPMVVDDTTASSRPPRLVETYKALKIGAIINAPSSRDQRLRFMLTATKPVPHRWRSDEIDLMRQLSNIIRLKLERAEAETALRESESKFHDLADNISQFAWMAEANGSIFWYNQRWFDYTGTTLAEMEDWGWKAVQHPDHLERVVTHWQNALDTGQVWEDTFPLRSKDGEYRWFLSRAQPIRDADGKIVRWFGTNTDITEEKRWELELADREAHLRRVINNQLGLVGVIDRNGILVEVDDRSMSIAGLTRDDVIGKHFAECAWWTYDQAVSQKMRDSMKRAFAGETVRYDVGLYASGNQRLMIDFMIAPVYDDAGNITHLIPSGVDISERKLAEARLAESKERLSMAMASARMGSFEWELDTDKITWDDQHLAITGLTNHFSTGAEFLKIIHPEDVALHQQAIDATLHGDIEYEIEFRIIRPDGSIRWLAARGEIIASDEARATRFVGMNWDITEAKEQERRIRESEARLRNAAEAAGFGTVHVNLLSGTATYSKELRELIGLQGNADDRVQIEGIPEWVYSDDRHICAEHYKELVQMAEGSTGRIDHRIIRPNGEVRWVRMQTKPVYGGLGAKRKVTELIGTVIDITPQREFEQSLQEARHEAEAANQSKSEFLANMSHEIRTPMTAVLGYTDLLLARESNLEKREFLQTIKRNGSFLLEIVNDILDLSKIEAGKLEVARNRFAPHELVADVRSLMDVRASEKYLKFDIEYEGAIPAQIESDPKRLKQILVNLLGNAIKFTEAGSVRLIVRFLSHPTPRLQFEVIDTGIGMTREQQRRLFKPFSQGDASVNRQYGGTGLGLAISLRLAKMLGGSIQCESHVGQGSRFSCTISVGDVSKTQLISPSLGPVHESSISSLPVKPLDCHVLVVDDRRDVRFLTKHFLTKAGATVELAEDGQHALDFYDRVQREEIQPVDLILLDMQMPRIDGYQTAAELRKRGFVMPIIALTADAMHGDMNRCLECGCDSYLSKPIDGNALIEMVAKYTQRS